MRVEWIHPMLVHFPIALLLTGAVVRAAAYFFKRGVYLEFSARLILTVGVVFAWAAALAGEAAADVVRPALCNADALEDHYKLAYAAAGAFSIAVFLDWARGFRRRWLKIAGAILYCLGAALLVAAATFGGGLVYEQGAAVENVCRQPS